MRITEPVGPGLTRTWEVSDVRYEARTKYQNVLIGRTAQGISLFCDGERQSTEASQLVYHEALMVPALLLAAQVRRVLIIGSSEGVASELALSAGASHVDHVDIDAEAVRACAEHLPYGYTPAFLDRAERFEGPVHVHYRDGWEFLAATTDAYDVVVIDLPDENDDPDAQHNRLYGTDFLRRCAAVLAPGGVVTGQAGCPTLWRQDTLRASWRRFHEVFATVFYHGSAEHEWAYLTGTPTPLPTPLTQALHALTTTRLQPSTIDAATLRAASIPPISLRQTP